MLFRLYLTEAVVILEALVITALIVVVLGYTCYWLLHNALAPMKRVRAKVVRKRTRAWDGPIVVHVPMMSLARLGILLREGLAAIKTFLHIGDADDTKEATYAEGADLFMTFAFDGREMEFCVPMQTYIECDEGLEGLLVFKGEQFKYFIAGVG